MNPTGERKAGGEPWSIRDLGGNPRLAIDAAGAPFAFVAASRFLGLPAAAGTAMALVTALVVTRLIRGHPVGYALGGLGGTAIAVGAALWSGDATGYFGPAMLLNTGYALVAILSIIVRRPLVAWIGALLYRWPLRWYWHPRVRPAYTEVTWAWAGLFTLRAGSRYALIQSGHLEALAVVHIAVGLPALAAWVAFTYWYLQWRLARLDAPAVSDFRPRAPTEPPRSTF